MGFSIKQTLSGLFGGGKPANEDKDGTDTAPGEGADYKGYTIHPVPKRQGGSWLTAGVIRKAGADGSVREHRFIRADTHSTQDDAAAMAAEKGKRIVDEQGERMFDAG